MNYSLEVTTPDRVEANPFRDIENYPFWRDKLDRLKESIRATGVWPNIIVRKHPEKEGFFQQAFGHHRLQAVKEMMESGELGKGLQVLVGEFSNDELLRMMADENAEEFGTNFALGTMNAVSAVVKAYAAGVVELRIPTGPHARIAPSFVEVSGGGTGKVYNASTVAEYLGWVEKDPHSPTGLGAASRVKTALFALELIELGVCKPEAFQGLGHEQARVVVKQAQVVYKARMRELDAKAEEKEKKAAQKEAVKKAGLSVAKNVAAIRDGEGIRAIREETKKVRSEAQAVPTQKVVQATQTDVSDLVGRATREVATASGALSAVLINYAGTFKALKKGAICDPQVRRDFEGVLGELDKNLTLLMREI